LNNFAIVKGLNLSYSPGGSGPSSQVLIINPGYITLDEKIVQSDIWLANSIYKQDLSYSFKLQSNGGNNEILFALYAYPNSSVVYSKDTYSLYFKVKQIDIQNYQEDPEGGVFLSFVLLPPMFPTINTKSYFKSVNLNQQDTSFAITWDTFYHSILEKILIWAPDNFYLVGQIIRRDATIWYCTMTHASSNNFDDDKFLFWTGLTSSGGISNPSDVQDIIYTDQTETIDLTDYQVTYLILPDARELIVSTKAI
jgi:hypothetical protein